MKRRDFLLQLSALPAMATVATALSRDTVADKFPSGWRVFELVTTVDIAEPDGRTHVWLPIPLRQDGRDRERTNQRLMAEPTWDAPGASRAELVTVSGYGVELLHVEWPGAQAVGRVMLTDRVATRDPQFAFDKRRMPRSMRESSAVLDTYLQPTKLLKTDGIVKETAARITRGQRSDLDKARALYEWVVENTSRDPKTPGCGLGDVASMLSSGNLGGKCVDINGLFVALARSVQIPARDVYGLRVADSRRGFTCLGKSGNVTKGQHCRAEFYAQGYGWIPADPADVRKLILEEPPSGLPLSDSKVQEARRILFGGWEMNWVAYNYGHDVPLPGSEQFAVPFLMYPQAETGERRLDSLDPASFRYEINVREVT